MPVLAINDRIIPDAPPTAAKFLLGLPRGPYTSLIVQQNKRVQCWREHCSRLSQSFSILAQSGICQDWQKLSGDGAETVSQIRELVAPTLNLALAAHATSPERSSHISATILLNPADRSRSKSARGALDIWVHASALSWPAANLQTPVEVTLLRNGQRTLPAAKDSLWATERKPLEAAILPTSSEGILCSSSGKLLEGLVTNFFVVKGSIDTPVLQTASVAEGILDGVVRQKVLKVCYELGISVLEEAPDAAVSNQWREAFLTNCRRLVQPIAQVRHASVEAPPVWTCQTPTGAGPLTSQLYTMLSKLLSEESTAIQS